MAGIRRVAAPVNLDNIMLIVNRRDIAIVNFSKDSLFLKRLLVVGKFQFIPFSKEKLAYVLTPYIH